MDCTNCRWSLPDTCRICKAEQLEKRILEVAQQVAKVKQVDIFRRYESAQIELFVN